ncbi:MAG: SNF2-related protein [Planctomycetota bacterium]
MDYTKYHCQYWVNALTVEASAGRKRKILLIVPAALRKQWQQELETKFYLPTMVLDSKIYNWEVKSGSGAPFSQKNKIVVCSYHFASSKNTDILNIPWDTVVIDEAHRLRNVYKSSSKLAKKIKKAIGSSPKLLLTATPLQNSLMELYGLASIIDGHIFGEEQRLDAS